MKLKLCMAAMLLLLGNVKARPAEPLTVGDKVPLLPLANIINAAYKNSNTGQWQGKLLVLDFMATTCKGCIMALPRLDSLQARYKDKLQIFLVTYEDSAAVKTFLSRNHIGRQIHLPFVTGDTLLSEYFPHMWLSHDVWINPAQEVLAITEAEYVNDSNIARALSGVKINWPLKLDFTLHDDSQPLLDYHDADSFYFKKPEAACYTFFSGYYNTRAISFLFTKDTANNRQRFCITNYPIVQMYQLAYGDIFLPHSHIDLHVQNKGRYIYEKGAEYLNVWDSRNRYCYEAILPLTMSEMAVRQKVVADLDNYFGLRSGFKKQEVACLVLKDIPAAGKPAPLPDSARGITLANLLYLLNNGQYGTPVLNEIGADENMRLPLSGHETIDQVNTALAPYGLVLLKLNRTVRMLTITETTE